MMVDLFSQDLTAEEEEAVSAFMRRVAVVPEADRQRPDPTVLWWKAQLVRRWNRRRST
jgi:hypothetical protein